MSEKVVSLKPDDDETQIVVVYQADYGVNLHLLPYMGEPFMDQPSDCLMMIPRPIVTE